MRNRIGQLPDPERHGSVGHDLLGVETARELQSAVCRAQGRPALGTGLQIESQRKVLPRAGFLVEAHTILISDGYMWRRTQASTNRTNSSALSM